MTPALAVVFLARPVTVGSGMRGGNTARRSQAPREKACMSRHCAETLTSNALRPHSEATMPKKSTKPRKGGKYGG